MPVVAPEGTMALNLPLFVVNSASTVGFPLESSTCLPMIDWIYDPNFIEDLIIFFIYKLFNSKDDADTNILRWLSTSLFSHLYPSLSN